MPTNCRIVLHPWHKLNYFKHAGWESNWINIAEQLVHNQFQHSYSTSDSTADVATAANSDVEASTTCLGQVSNIFNDLPSLAPLKVTDQRSELDRYLGSDVKNIIDALQWWNGHCKAYPHLSRIALDYLTIPGVLCVHLVAETSLAVIDNQVATSVDVKQLFSQGHLLLSHVHSGLSSQSTWALLCLGFWNTLGLVKDKDVQNVLSLADVVEDDKEMSEGWDSVVDVEE